MAIQEAFITFFLSDGSPVSTSTGNSANCQVFGFEPQLRPASVRVQTLFGTVNVSLDQTVQRQLVNLNVTGPGGCQGGVLTATVQPNGFCTASPAPTPTPQPQPQQRTEIIIITRKGECRC